MRMRPGIRLRIHCIRNAPDALAACMRSDDDAIIPPAATITAVKEAMLEKDFPHSESAHVRSNELHTSASRTALFVQRSTRLLTFFLERKLRAVCVIATCAFATQIIAQEASIETDLIAEVRVDASRESGILAARYVPATLVSQGEVVYYTLRIRNSAQTYAKNVVVVQRVPANTVYVEGSAAGPGAEVFFSIDGGQTFARADELKAADVSGAQQVASSDRYTHIQWRLRYALAPGAVALARFRAVFQ